MESSADHRPFGDGAIPARSGSSDETLPMGDTVGGGSGSGVAGEHSSVHGHSSGHSHGSYPSTPTSWSQRQHAVRDGVESEGDIVGDYKLLTRLGTGGFGTVWLAKRICDFDQMVAIKVVKPGMDTNSVIERFRQEMQLLALMDHPHIAKVFAAGTTPGGRPFFVMERVDGQPLTRYADEHRLTLEERLRLFLQVCDAVQYAHYKEIVHRDLKPSNILVAPDGNGGANAKVIDFGIAKALARPAHDGGAAAESGQMIGTFEYMSPEQANGSDDIDGRSDVYSLGVILYELLVGAPPLEAKQLRRNTRAEIQRIIREQAPQTPSERLASLIAAGGDAARRNAQLRRSTPARLASVIGRELGWIPMKAMSKDRDARYATPQALAEDVRSFLAGDTVSAVPPTPAYRVRKLVRTHRLAMTMSGFALVAVASMVFQMVATSSRAEMYADDGVHAWFRVAKGDMPELILDRTAQDPRVGEQALRSAESNQRAIIESLLRERDHEYERLSTYNKRLAPRAGQAPGEPRADAAAGGAAQGAGVQAAASNAASGVSSGESPNTASNSPATAGIATGNESPEQIEELYRLKRVCLDEIASVERDLAAAYARHAWFLFWLGQPAEAIASQRLAAPDESKLTRAQRELHAEAIDFYENHAPGDQPPATWSLTAPWGGKVMLRKSRG